MNNNSLYQTILMKKNKQRTHYTKSNAIYYESTWLTQIQLTCCRRTSIMMKFHMPIPDWFKAPVYLRVHACKCCTDVC